MRLALLLLTLALTLAVTGKASAQAAAAATPTDSALRRAWERNAHTVVEVSRKDGRRGAGVIVSADGHIATSTHNVDFDSATVHYEGEVLAARVIAADARTRVALLHLTLPASHAPLRAAEANIGATLGRSQWLVGIEPHTSNTERATRPAAGKVLQPVIAPRPHLLAALALAPGSPLFDDRGRLVALVVERAGRHASLAVPLSTVEAQAKAALLAETPAP